MTQSKFLGETIVDVKTHPEFSSYTSADWALLYLSKFGQIEGEHHKAWVMDQVARILNGTPVIVEKALWENGEHEYRFTLEEKPSKKYKDWRKKMLGKKYPKGSREQLSGIETEYHYNEGITP